MNELINSCTDLMLSGFYGLDNLLSTFTSPLDSKFSYYFPRFAARSKASLLSIKSNHADLLPLTHPTNMLVLLLGYLVMVQIGPKIIRTKRNVTLYVTLHNLAMTFMSLFMFLEISRQAWLGHYSLFGNPKRDSHIAMAKVLALFYCSKILEFNDTFIMLLKQNFRQISFLHIYHHASIFAIWWLVSYWAPTGDSYFPAMLNSFIHVIMYGYYFLAGIGVNSVRAVKKYVTKMQIIQFCFMMVQANYNLCFVHSSKVDFPEGAQPYPMSLSALLWVYMVSMLSLFYNFYKQDRQRERQMKKKSN